MNLVELRKLPAFLSTVRIETDSEPMAFASVADDWQRRDVDAIAPAIERLVQPGPEPACRRAWWVRPRGHGKTADAAMLAAFVLAFSRRRRRAVWVAADRDQGCEGLDSIATLCRHNDWLDKLLTIRADKVENPRTGSVCYFTTSDVSSAFGWKDCDLFLMDEVTHWRTNGEDLWTAIYSAAGKRKGAVVLAMMNAGFDNWARRLRDTAASDPAWAFSELPDAVASWIDPARLADQAKYVPATAFNRLWRNRWVEGQAGDAIDPALLARAFDPALQPHTRAVPGFTYCAGLDVGITRHASCLCVLAVRRGWQEHALVQLAALKVWRPSPGKRVELGDIEDELRRLHELFDFKRLNYDPWESRFLASRLQAGGLGKLTTPSDRKAGLPMVECPPSSANLAKMAQVLLQAFADVRLRLYPDPVLKRDLELLRIEERQFGIRLVSPESRDATGTPHGDAASAFALALLAASELASKKRMVVGAPDSDPDFDADENPMERSRRRLLKQRNREQRARERRQRLIDSMPSDRTLGMLQAMAKKVGARNVMRRENF